MPSAFERLQRRIRRREARVAILGLGYVGLPLAVTLAEAGFHVLGLDRDPKRRATLRAGRSYIPDVPSRTVKGLLGQRQLRVADRPAALGPADVVIICVPTPLSKTREPDLTDLLEAVSTVARHLHPPALVILESTTYPGTTDEVVRRFFEEAGRRLDHDVFLAFSPERIDPGNLRFGLRAIPKLVGGVTPKATRLAECLYRQALDQVVPVSSSRVAEMAKLLENTFRIINIALANEFALLCHALGVDVWEVIEAASTKPFGFMPFYPGPGIGGHCIPSDPLYLSWRARAEGVEARLIDLAAQINNRMPHHVVERVGDLLNARGTAMKGARILVIGAAYKRDVNDTRESPALAILHLLAQRGARVAYHDPFVPLVQLNGTAWRSTPLTPEAVKAKDCVVIATDHSGVGYRLLGRHATFIFDTRNAMRAVEPAQATVVRL